MAAVVVIKLEDTESRTDSPDGGTDIAPLVRRALAEVCTVSLLVVFDMRVATENSHFALFDGDCIGPREG